jgi:cytochrome c-type biogenesis protein CcmH
MRRSAQWSVLSAQAPTRPWFRFYCALCTVLCALLFISLPLLAQTEVKVPDADQLVGAPKGTPLTGDELTRQTQEIASAIRCPVCQGLSIADSPSEMAQNMKAQVRNLLARGYTRPQIESYFERSYGQFVLLKPRFKGINSLVWTLPIFALLAGIAIVIFKIKDLASDAPAAASTKHQPPTTTPVDDPYLARVRELVKGDSQ